MFLLSSRKKNWNHAFGNHCNQNNCCTCLAQYPLSISVFMILEHGTRSCEAPITIVCDSDWRKVNFTCFQDFQLATKIFSSQKGFSVLLFFLVFSSYLVCDLFWGHFAGCNLFRLLCLEFHFLSFTETVGIFFQPLFQRGLIFALGSNFFKIISYLREPDHHYYGTRIQDYVANKNHDLGTQNVCRSLYFVETQGCSEF